MNYELSWNETDAYLVVFEVKESQKGSKNTTVCSAQ